MKSNLKTIRIKSINVPDRGSFVLAGSTDAEVVLSIIKDGFKTWVKEGLIFSPSRQTLSETIDQIEKGSVFLYREGSTPKATFSFEVSEIKVNANELRLVTFKGEDNFIALEKWQPQFAKENSILFHKFSVVQTEQNQGLGIKILNDFIESMRENGFESIFIETTPNAPWLYNWYVNQGFEVVASNEINGTPIVTYLMRYPLNSLI